MKIKNVVFVAPVCRFCSRILTFKGKYFVIYLINPPGPLGYSSLPSKATRIHFSNLICMEEILCSDNWVIKDIDFHRLTMAEQ